MRPSKRLTIIVIVLGVASLANAAESYIPRLNHRVAQWREELPALKTTAGAAATGVLAGGSLYITGPQQSFPPEGSGRAGGLMLIKGYGPNAELSDRDTILAAMTGDESEEALATLAEMIDRAGAVGAKVVLFAGAARDRLPEPGANLSILPRKPFEEGEAISDLSIESVSNVIALWTWTGEFVAACVAHNRMPCLYESYLLPGGRERGQALTTANGGRFHEVAQVTSKDAAGLGARYLDAVEESLANVWLLDQDAFQRAAGLIPEARNKGHVIGVYHIGHMFPSEFQVAQCPGWIQSAGAEQTPEPEGVALMLEYQAFPRARTDDFAKRGIACIVIGSHVPPAEFTSNPRNVTINPFWDIYDSAVELPGYDVRVLPLSGVMDSAVFWQLVEMLAGD